jgi:hypothetical protein
MAHTTPPSTPAAVCRLVALLWGARATVWPMVSREPYQGAPRICPISACELKLSNRRKCRTTPFACSGSSRDSCRANPFARRPAGRGKTLGCFGGHGPTKSGQSSQVAERQQKTAKPTSTGLVCGPVVSGHQRCWVRSRPRRWSAPNAVPKCASSPSSQSGVAGRISRKIALIVPCGTRRRTCGCLGTTVDTPRPVA